MALCMLAYHSSNVVFTAQIWYSETSFNVPSMSSKDGEERNDLIREMRLSCTYCVHKILLSLISSLVGDQVDLFDKSVRSLKAVSKYTVSNFIPLKCKRFSSFVLCFLYKALMAI